MKTPEEKRAYDREKSRRWRLNNPEKNKEVQRFHDAERRRDPVKKARRKEQRRKTHLNNLEKSRKSKRRSHFKWLYGITLAEKEFILSEQGYVCAACGSESPKSKIGWHLDHCHRTGKVRGVLCRSCNTALGLADDDPARLRAMADYLERTSPL